MHLTCYELANWCHVCMQRTIGYFDTRLHHSHLSIGEAKHKKKIEEGWF